MPDRNILPSWLWSQEYKTSPTFPFAANVPAAPFFWGEGRACSHTDNLVLFSFSVFCPGRTSLSERKRGWRARAEQNGRQLVGARPWRGKPAADKLVLLAPEARYWTSWWKKKSSAGARYGRSTRNACHRHVSCSVVLQPNSTIWESWRTNIGHRTLGKGGSGPAGTILVQRLSLPCHIFFLFSVS